MNNFDRIAPSFSQNLTEKLLDKDILKRKRDSDPNKRMKDLPYLGLFFHLLN